jgi:hypothetical protein
LKGRWDGEGIARSEILGQRTLVDLAACAAAVYAIDANIIICAILQNNLEVEHCVGRV